MATRYEYYITGDDAASGLFGISWESQSFTVQAGQAHTIISVKLKLHRVGSPGTVTVSIRAADGDETPTGADLTSENFDGDALTTDVGGEWKEIVFGTPIDLSESTQYCIVIRAPTGNSSNRILWHVDVSSPTYAGGVRGTSPDGGANWGAWDGTDNANYDDLFEEWGDAPVSSVGGFNPALGELML